MELIEAKITAIITLTLGSMLAGLMPAWFSSYGRHNYPLFLSALLCFGGGVLLSTSVVHMLPEIREALPDHKQYTEILFCAGFFVLYLVDEFVHYCFKRHHHHQNQNRSFEGGQSSTSAYGTNSETEPLRYGWRPEHNTIPQTYINTRSDHAIFGNSSNLCHIGHEEPCSNNTAVGTIGLLAALSIHAVLEGLAVGLETSVTQALLLLGAIASHKLVVGFCLGMELASLENGSPFKHFIAITIFSCGSPTGIALGMFVSNIPEHIVEYLLPILQCIAAGTLLYVSICEVLPRERSRWHQQYQKRHAGIVQYLFMLTGFVLMTVLTCYMED